MLGIRKVWDAKVSNLDLIVVLAIEEVGRLDVTVDDALVMDWGISAETTR